jgi:hypothetical protein
MREIRLSGSEGGVALIAPSLPLSVAVSRCARGFCAREVFLIYQLVRAMSRRIETVLS